MASATNLLEIPASIRCDRRGSCVPVTLFCLPQLVEGRDFVIEGWVSFGTTKERHTWMVIDGKIFDPSLVQFCRFKNYAFGPTYMARFKHTPVDFRRYWDGYKSFSWRARLASFGVPRTSWVFA
jgi:hypothetical protein